MANDWTPMRNDLHDDPAVLTISEVSGLDVDAVVGKLLRVWGWAGAHTVTGKCAGVTLRHVDVVAGAEKFGDGMKAAGWLDVDESGTVTLAKWKKYNGKAAKQRILAAKRASRYRAQKRDARHASNASTEQNRTVYKNPPTPQPDEWVNHQPKPEPPPETHRLIWSQVAALYVAYPVPHRGSKGEFLRAVGEAWARLVSDNESDPAARLLAVTRAYAESWTGKREGGKFTLSPKRFYAHDGEWTRDPRDWGEPGKADPAKGAAWAKVGEIRRACEQIEREGGYERVNRDTDHSFAARRARLDQLRIDLELATLTAKGQG